MRWSPNIAAYLVAIPASRVLSHRLREVFRGGHGRNGGRGGAVVGGAEGGDCARGRARRSGLVRLGVQTAVLVAVFSLVAGAVLVPLTRVPVAAAAAGMVMAPLITLTAAAQGFLQGRAEFRRPGWLLGLVGVLRSGPMIAALLLGASATVALWVGAVGTLISTAFAWGLLKKVPRPPPRGNIPLLTRGASSAVDPTSGASWAHHRCSWPRWWRCRSTFASCSPMPTRASMRSARSRRRPHSGCRRRSGPWSIRRLATPNGGRSRCALPSGWCRGSAG